MSNTKSIRQKLIQDTIHAINKYKFIERGDERTLADFSYELMPREEALSLYKRWIGLYISEGVLNKDLDENNFFCKPTTYKLPYRRYTAEEFIHGIMHSDDRYMTFKRRAFEKLSTAIPPSIKDKYGFCDSRAVPGDFSRLMSITGSAPNERGYMLRDNRKDRKASGLREEWASDPLARHLGECLAILMCGIYKPSHTKANGISRSGKPFNVRDKWFKQIHHIVCCHYREEITEAINKVDTQTLLRNFGVSFDGEVGTRKQADRTGKVRTIVPEEMAFEGKGGRREVDNIFWKDGADTGFVTMRLRDVFGYNSAVNMVLQSVVTPLLHGFYDVFPKTFKITGGEDFATKIEDSMNEFIVRGYAPVVETSDIGNFDNHMDFSIRSLLIKRMEVISRTGYLFEDKINGAGVYFPPTSEGVNEGKFLGGCDSLKSVEAGRPLASGAASVTKDGRFCGAHDNLFRWAKVCIEKDFDRYEDLMRTDYAITWICKILNHHSDSKMHMFVFSDDQLRIFANEELQMCFHAQEGIYNMLPEDLPQLVGWVPFVETEFPDGRVKIKCVHNITTYVTNLFTPERGVQSRLRKYAGHGMNARRGVYSDAPTFSLCNEILEDVWKDCYPEYGSLGSLIDAKEQEEEEIAVSSSIEDFFGAPGKGFINFDSLTEIDKEVILDRDKLSWKYTMDDVSEAVRAMIIGTSTHPGYGLDIVNREIINDFVRSDIPGVDPKVFILGEIYDNIRHAFVQ